MGFFFPHWKFVLENWLKRKRIAKMLLPYHNSTNNWVNSWIVHIVFPFTGEQWTMNIEHFIICWCDFEKCVRYRSLSVFSVFNVRMTLFSIVRKLYKHTSHTHTRAHTTHNFLSLRFVFIFNHLRHFGSFVCNPTSPAVPLAYNDNSGKTIWKLKTWYDYITFELHRKLQTKKKTKLNWIRVGRATLLYFFCWFSLTF